MLGSLGKVKDDVVQALVRKALAAELGPYGELTEFSLDTEGRVIRFGLLLRGEAGPVLGEVLGFEVERGEPGRGGALMLHEVRLSRPWMETFLARHPSLRRIPLPSDLAVKLAELALGGRP